MAKAKNFTPPKPIVGINWLGPEAYAFCNDVKWGIKPLAHTKAVVDKIMTIFETHKQQVDDLGPAAPVHTLNKIDQDTASKVLNLSLVDFKYDDAANNTDTPPGLLAALAVEMRDFLGAGGTLGMQHLQTQLNMRKRTS